MPKNDLNKSCFIIMPVTTPPNLIEGYLNDDEHFKHVMDCLFSPAIVNAGFKPLNPISSGSSIIHADILKNLSEADLVLCDMSILNPNVFFEFGIRTALNKPVALVRDDKIPDLPFDTSPIHCYKYDSSLSPWLLEKQIDDLNNHIQETFNKSADYNPMWKIFGGGQAGDLKPGALTNNEQFDFLLEKMRNIESQLSLIKTKTPVVGYSGYSSVGDVFPNKPATIFDLYAQWTVNQMTMNAKKLEEAKNNLFRKITESIIIKSPQKDPEKKIDLMTPPAPRPSAGGRKLD
ncbi:MAG: hypothetical protein MUO31_00795 [Thermodesulfovibrionales bacterium]|nr:hypothetical protein [Thermodesulfovibrionales bacterium]